MEIIQRGTLAGSASAVDKELAMYALTLINKSLYGIPSQDSFFDQTDFLDQVPEAVFLVVCSPSMKEL